MRYSRLSLHGGEVWLAVVAFLLLTLAATWPLPLRLTSSLPSDYGDPLFVVWVMAWVGRHFGDALRGDVGALVRMWDAPIFVPEHNTLAFSEHFAAQAVTALPIYWLSGNPLLAYNLVFLSTFVLSAVGAYVLVRELTGSAMGAWVSGTIYGFNVYRAISLSHLHTLSSQWVPFALVAMLVFARTGARRALAFAALALITSNLSSGYYMAYFAPFVAGFAVVALRAHPGWRRPGAWMAIAAALVAVVVVELPWVVPYLDMQRAQQFTRSRSEVETASLTLTAYRAALPHLASMLLLSMAALLHGRAERSLRWAVYFFGVAGVLAFWLSLGPVPRGDGGIPLAVPGIYGLLLDHAPGFSGLRVAARFAMPLMLSLAVLAGIGAARLASFGAGGKAVATAALIAHMVVYWTAPFPLDTPVATATANPTPDYLRPAPELPPIYRFVRTTASSSVLVELPFGEPGYEVRYMFFALAHRRPLLNGYSGVFPASYRARVGALRAPWNDFDRAWNALAPATHVVVHHAAWSVERGDAIRAWLTRRGARPLVERDGASLWQLR